MKKREYDTRYKKIRDNKELSFLKKKKAYDELEAEAKIQRNQFFEELRAQDKQVEERLKKIDEDNALTKEDKAFLKEAIILLNAGSQSAAIAGIKRFGFDFTKMIGKGIKAASSGLAMKKDLKKLYKNYEKDKKDPEDIPLMVLAQLAERGLLFNTHLLEGLITVLPTFNRAQDFALTAFDKLLDTFVAKKIPLPKEESKRLISVLKGITGALFSPELKDSESLTTLLRSDELRDLFDEITRVITAESKKEKVEFNEGKVLPLISKLLSVLGEEQLQKVLSKEVFNDIKKISISVATSVVTKKEQAGKKNQPKKSKPKEKKLESDKPKPEKQEEKESLTDNVNFLLDQVEHVLNPLSNNTKVAGKVIELVEDKDVAELLDIVFPILIEQIGEQDKEKLKQEEELEKQGIEVKKESKLEKLKKYPEILKFVGENIDALIGQLGNIKELAKHEEFKNALRNLVSGDNVEIDWTKMQGLEKELFEAINGLGMQNIIKSDNLKSLLTKAIAPEGQKKTKMQELMLEFIQGSGEQTPTGFQAVQNILGGLFQEQFLKSNLDLFKEIFIDTSVAKKPEKFSEKIFASLKLEKLVSGSNILHKILASVKANPQLKEEDLKVLHQFFLQNDEHRSVLKNALKEMVNSDVSLRKLNINTDEIVDTFKDYQIFEKALKAFEGIADTKDWATSLHGILGVAKMTGSLGLVFKSLLSLIAALIFEKLVPKELKTTMIRDELEKAFAEKNVGAYLDKAVEGHMGAKEYYLKCRSLIYLDLREFQFSDKILDQFNLKGALLPNNMEKAVISKTDFSRVEFYDGAKATDVVNLKGAKIDYLSLKSLFSNPKVMKIEGVDLSKFPEIPKDEKQLMTASGKFVATSVQRV